MKAILAPPVSVDAVGRVAAAAAIGKLSAQGVMEVEDINRLASSA
jgi:hypothetical protein